MVYVNGFSVVAWALKRMNVQIEDRKPSKDASTHTLSKTLRTLIFLPKYCPRVGLMNCHRQCTTALFVVSTRRDEPQLSAEVR